MEKKGKVSVKKRKMTEWNTKRIYKKESSKERRCAVKGLQKRKDRGK